MRRSHGWMSGNLQKSYFRKPAASQQSRPQDHEPSRRLPVTSTQQTCASPSADSGLADLVVERSVSALHYSTYSTQILRSEVGG